ncbi:hypothetical protein [Anaerospora hongkongensis]|uniref:hypothetical protein n=1 Tax=Anaerospora hongkongensis TaxID=244830 RepID=UPI002FD95CBF
MYKIANWEVKIGKSLNNKLTFYENSKHIIAMRDGQVVAIIRAVNDDSPRIEATNIAIFISEKEHAIYLNEIMSLNEVVDYEQKFPNSCHRVDREE